MPISSLRFLVLAAGMPLCAAGCQLLGPTAIDQGRDRYNGVIQQTSMEQTLSNIVRTYDHEPTLFMEVTEVDAANQVGGSINAAATNIGARAGRSLTAGTLAGQVGSFGGSLQYSETPTIRYQPLSGQPLVAQLVSPVSVDAIGDLYDSYWNAAPLLDFSVAYLTLDYGEFYPALNALTELNSDGAIELVAGKSKFSQASDAVTKTPITKTAGGTLTVELAEKSSKGSGGNDSLVVYLLPFHPRDTSTADALKKRDMQLWMRLLRLYAGTQPAFAAPKACQQFGIAMDDRTLRDWDTRIDAYAQKYPLNEVRKCLPDTIELRTVPVTHNQRTAEGLISAAPLMRTYSALGLLKNAVERPHPRVEFVTPAAYSAIRAHRWNQNPEGSSFYTLLPGDEDSFNCPASQGKCDNPANAKDADQSKRVDADVSDWINKSDNLLSYERKSGASDDMLDDAHIKGSTRLGLLRRYILVIVSDRLPSGPAYASFEEHGRVYYIAGDDPVSQKNFHLLSLFMTMMAIPSQLPPLSPVINVGG